MNPICKDMKVKYKVVFKNESITLSKHPEKEEFWLYDYGRGMNLAMNAKREQDAFVSALTYYQKRLTLVEKEFKTLQDKVNIFIEGVTEEDEQERDFY